MRFAYEKLAPWLTKIFPLAMPQILVADVIVAARLQSLDFVKNYVAKVQIFPELAKLFSNYFAGKMQSMQLFIYSNTTGRF